MACSSIGYEAVHRHAGHLRCCGAALYRAGPVSLCTAGLGAVLRAASAESGSPHAGPADIRRISSAVLPAGRRGAIPAHEAILATPRPLAWPRSLLALERAMGDPTGFLKTARQDCARRPVRERVRDWNEVYDRQSLLPIITTQAGRCMEHAARYKPDQHGAIEGR